MHSKTKTSTSIPPASLFAAPRLLEDRVINSNQPRRLARCDFVRALALAGVFASALTTFPAYAGEGTPQPPLVQTFAPIAETLKPTTPCLSAAKAKEILGVRDKIERNEARLVRLKRHFFEKLSEAGDLRDEMDAPVHRSIGDLRIHRAALLKDAQAYQDIIAELKNEDQSLEARLQDLNEGC